MLFRQVRTMQSPDAQSSLESNFNSDGDSGNVQQSEGAAGGDNRLYNEHRKLQRLFEKQSKEYQALKNEIEPLKAQFSKFQGLFNPQAPQDSQQMSYLEKVRMADKSIRDADPSSNGLALTLEGAELIEQLREQNEKLIQQVKFMSSPEFTAEQQMFVNIEGGIRDTMSQFFGDSGVDDNYPDFERVAIERLKEVKKDPKKWASILRSPEMQKQFVRSVVTAKMPKLENIPGWKKVESYGVEDAKRDLVRSEQMATKARQDKNGQMMREASALATKARQRLLPETLGLKFRDE